MTLALNKQTGSGSVRICRQQLCWLHYGIVSGDFLFLDDVRPTCKNGYQWDTRMANIC